MTRRATRTRRWESRKVRRTERRSQRLSPLPPLPPLLPSFASSFPQSHLCIRLKTPLAAGKRREEVKEVESKQQPTEMKEDGAVNSSTAASDDVTSTSASRPTIPPSTPEPSLARSNSNPPPSSSSSSARRRRSRSRSRSAAREAVKGKASSQTAQSGPAGGTATARCSTR